MIVRVLGAHNTESKYTKQMCLLVDGVLALDAGSLTSGLSFRQQMKIKALFLTHSHYDHLRDIPGFAMNLYLRRKSVDIYTHEAARDNLVNYLLNGKLYPEFHRKPGNSPTLRIHVLDPYQKIRVAGYDITAAPVNHALPAMGYQIVSPAGRSIFYTGDTGSGLADIWKQITPQMLFIELTALNRFEGSMQENGHLTSNLLEQELIDFNVIKGYWPRVVTVHMNSADEPGIKTEVTKVVKSLGVPITLAREGMRLRV
jgi:ribonuclease BN (tRNA processing enzyme)